MTSDELDILAARIAERISVQPRWLKLKQAVEYGSMGEKRLKKLAMNGEIDGYPENRRGDWIFDRYSIDKYRLKPIEETNVRFKKLLDSR